jgi:hypothetical protein
MLSPNVLIELGSLVLRVARALCPGQDKETGVGHQA